MFQILILFQSFAIVLLQSQESFDLFEVEPDNKLLVMGYPITRQDKRLPFLNNKGLMRIGQQIEEDEKFLKEEIITYQAKKAGTGPWQWLGWRSRNFASKRLEVSVWVKFIDEIPPPSSNFGFKIYGKIDNTWVQNCHINKWCFVKRTYDCAASGDSYLVIMIFDSITSSHQVIKISQFKVRIVQTGQVFEMMRKSLDKNLFIMGSKGFNSVKTRGGGKMYLHSHDEKFSGRDIITWENTNGKEDPWQWLGWPSPVFANKMLQISFFIKFVGTVPQPSWNFGVKVYGRVYNDWVYSCKPSVWCYVQQNIQCRASGDLNFVILIFDSIKQRQMVRIANFSVKIDWDKNF